MAEKTIYAALDFPGRTTVTLQEIATKLGVSCDTMEQHVDDGSLEPVTLQPKDSRRRLMRFTVDEYRRFVIARYNGGQRRQFFAELPRDTLRQIADEIAVQLAAKN